MERVHPPRSSDDAVPETIGPLPSKHRLNALLDAVRSPEVSQEDVDRFLRGLARPLVEGESARARADFLLSLIDDADVGDLLGKSGMTVRTAAVKALLDLGYPYALEIPPEALAEAQSTQQEAAPPEGIPLPGILAAFAGLLVQAVQTVPGFFTAPEELLGPVALMVLLALGAVLGPASLAVVAGLRRMPRLLKGSLVAMVLTGGIWTLVFMDHVSRRFPFRDTLTSISLVAALGFLGGAFLMRPSRWPPKAEEPEDEATPSTA